ncbi:IS66 family insertion sequence element accessory protein TnpB [Robbsia betulipollinis]|uniref:IS66 family insertion sequence element accessory protein TnpB n=1 Tax=Robbsia betulipollinis TaxID=2981849 RepID=UPI003D7B6667
MGGGAAFAAVSSWCDRLTRHTLIGLPTGTQVWLIAGATDMRRGLNGLAAIVQSTLASNPLRRPRVRLPRAARRSH